MANQIQLPVQQFLWKDIMDQFPAGRKMKRKIYFQAELYSLDNGDAQFRIIAYPAWRKRSSWQLGYKINAAESKPGSSMKFSEPIGFANNELCLSIPKKKKKRKKLKNRKEFVEFLEKITCDPKLAASAVFHIKTGVSENPHLEYDVTLEAGGTSVSLRSNPSPPGNPEY